MPWKNRWAVGTGFGLVVRICLNPCSSLPSDLFVGSWRIREGGGADYRN